jgi:Holliday junction DNA helicase RuvA
VADVLATVACGSLDPALGPGDLALLASVSGIGKRTAERIVVELRDKLGAAALEAVAAGDGASAPTADDPHLQARDALVALGFAVAEAESALAGTQGATEQRVKEALAALRRGGPT